MYQRPDMLTNPGVNPQGQALGPRKIQDNFEDFYEDPFEELSKYGLIESLNICDNLADHMMERDCLWLLRSWAHVIFTLRTEMLLMLLTKVQNHQEAFSDSFKAPLVGFHFLAPIYFLCFGAFEKFQFFVVL
ncbi:uncharacterized protein LOC126592995 isoform X1 [Malus sylvestris]|uniref:uncharacterized protein LOC126592995 isoform X1 n=1 Tax=Malus sylvestris TaxID=3752 RepID=UPI0021ABDC4D|nr:uncharacterized protein LOC126592995 isoform X1 [Malus sylvestris]